MLILQSNLRKIVNRYKNKKAEPIQYITMPPSNSFMKLPTGNTSFDYSGISNVKNQRSISPMLKKYYSSNSSNGLINQTGQTTQARDPLSQLNYSNNTINRSVSSNQIYGNRSLSNNQKGRRLTSKDLNQNYDENSSNSYIFNASSFIQNGNSISNIGNEISMNSLDNRKIINNQQINYSQQYQYPFHSHQFSGGSIGHMNINQNNMLANNTIQTIQQDNSQNNISYSHLNTTNLNFYQDIADGNYQQFNFSNRTSLNGGSIINNINNLYSQYTQQQVQQQFDKDQQELALTQQNMFYLQQQYENNNQQNNNNNNIQQKNNQFHNNSYNNSLNNNKTYNTTNQNNYIQNNQQNNSYPNFNQNTNHNANNNYSQLDMHALTLGQNQLMLLNQNQQSNNCTQLDSMQPQSNKNISMNLNNLKQNNLQIPLQNNLTGFDSKEDLSPSTQQNSSKFQQRKSPEFMNEQEDRILQVQENTKRSIQQGQNQKLSQEHIRSSKNSQRYQNISGFQEQSEQNKQNQKNEQDQYFNFQNNNRQSNQSNNLETSLTTNNNINDFVDNERAQENFEEDHLNVLESNIKNKEDAQMNIEYKFNDKNKLNQVCINTQDEIKQNKKESDQIKEDNLYIKEDRPLKVDAILSTYQAQQKILSQTCTQQQSTDLIKRSNLQEQKREQQTIIKDNSPILQTQQNSKIQQCQFGQYINQNEQEEDELVEAESVFQNSEHKQYLSAKKILSQKKLLEGTMRKNQSKNEENKSNFDINKETNSSNQRDSKIQQSNDEKKCSEFYYGEQSGQKSNRQMNYFNISDNQFRESRDNKLSEVDDIDAIKRNKRDLSCFVSNSKKMETFNPPTISSCINLEDRLQSSNKKHVYNLFGNNNIFQNNNNLNQKNMNLQFENTFENKENQRLQMNDFGIEYGRGDNNNQSDFSNSIVGGASSFTGTLNNTQKNTFIVNSNVPNDNYWSQIDNSANKSNNGQSVYHSIERRSEYTQPKHELSVEKKIVYPYTQCKYNDLFTPPEFLKKMTEGINLNQKGLNTTIDKITTDKIISTTILSKPQIAPNTPSLLSNVGTLYPNTTTSTITTTTTIITNTCISTNQNAANTSTMSSNCVTPSSAFAIPPIKTPLVQTNTASTHSLGILSGFNNASSSAYPYNHNSMLSSVPTTTTNPAVLSNQTNGEITLKKEHSCLLTNWDELLKQPGLKKPQSHKENNSGISPSSTSRIDSYLPNSIRNDNFSSAINNISSNINQRTSSYLNYNPLNTDSTNRSNINLLNMNQFNNNTNNINVIGQYNQASENNINCFNHLGNTPFLTQNSQTITQRKIQGNDEGSLQNINLTNTDSSRCDATRDEFNSSNINKPITQDCINQSNKNGIQYHKQYSQSPQSSINNINSTNIFTKGSRDKFSQKDTIHNRYTQETPIANRKEENLEENNSGLCQGYQTNSNNKNMRLNSSIDNSKWMRQNYHFQDNYSPASRTSKSQRIKNIRESCEQLYENGIQMQNTLQNLKNSAISQLQKSLDTSTLTYLKQVNNSDQKSSLIIRANSTINPRRESQNFIMQKQYQNEQQEQHRTPHKLNRSQSQYSSGSANREIEKQYLIETNAKTEYEISDSKPFKFSNYQRRISNNTTGGQYEQDQNNNSNNILFGNGNILQNNLNNANYNSTYPNESGINPLEMQSTTRRKNSTLVNKDSQIKSVFKQNQMYSVEESVNDPSSGQQFNVSECYKNKYGFYENDQYFDQGQNNYYLNDMPTSDVFYNYKQQIDEIREEQDKESNLQNQRSNQNSEQNENDEKDDDNLYHQNNLQDQNNNDYYDMEKQQEYYSQTELQQNVDDLQQEDEEEMNYDSDQIVMAEQLTTKQIFTEQQKKFFIDRLKLDQFTCEQMFDEIFADSNLNKISRAFFRFKIEQLLSTCDGNHSSRDECNSNTSIDSQNVDSLFDIINFKKDGFLDVNEFGFSIEQICESDAASQVKPALEYLKERLGINRCYITNQDLLGLFSNEEEHKEFMECVDSSQKGFFTYWDLYLNLQRELRKIVAKLKNQTDINGDLSIDNNTNNSTNNPNSVHSGSPTQGILQNGNNTQNFSSLNSNPKSVLNFLYKDKIKTDSTRLQNQNQTIGVGGFNISEREHIHKRNEPLNLDRITIDEKNKYIINSPIHKLMNPLNTQGKNINSPSFKIQNKYQKYQEENVRYVEDQLDLKNQKSPQSNTVESTTPQSLSKYNSSNNMATLANSCEISAEGSPVQLNYFQKKHNFPQQTVPHSNFQIEQGNRQNSANKKKSVDNKLNQFQFKDSISDRMHQPNQYDNNINGVQGSPCNNDKTESSIIKNLQVSNNLMLKHVKTTVTNLTRSKRVNSKSRHDQQSANPFSNSFSKNQKIESIKTESDSQERRYNNFQQLQKHFSQENGGCDVRDYVQTEPASRSSSNRQKSISFGFLPKSKNNIQFQTQDGSLVNETNQNDCQQKSSKKQVTAPYSVKVNKIDLSKVSKTSVIQKINEFLDFSKLNDIVNQQKNRVVQVQCSSPLFNLKKTLNNQTPTKPQTKGSKQFNHPSASPQNNQNTEKTNTFRRKNSSQNYNNNNSNNGNLKTSSSGNSNETLNSNRASLNEQIPITISDNVLTPGKNNTQSSQKEILSYSQTKQKNLQQILNDFPQLVSAFKQYPAERVIKEIFIESDRVIRHLSRDFFIFKIKVNKLSNKYQTQFIYLIKQFFLFQLQKLELDGFFDLCDLNCDKFVDVKEFGEIIENFCILQSSESRKIKVIYQNIDQTKQGSISQNNLQQYFQKYIPHFQQRDVFCHQQYKKQLHQILNCIFLYEQILQRDWPFSKYQFLGYTFTVTQFYYNENLLNLIYFQLNSSNNRLVKQLLEESPIDRKINQ